MLNGYFYVSFVNFLCILFTAIEALNIILLILKVLCKLEILALVICAVNIFSQLCHFPFTLLIYFYCEIMFSSKMNFF